jgi:hypothetical protein
MNHFTPHRLSFPHLTPQFSASRLSALHAAVFAALAKFMAPQAATTGSRAAQLAAPSGSAAQPATPSGSAAQPGTWCIDVGAISSSSARA